MGKPNIGKAFGALVRHPDDQVGVRLTEHVACALSQLPADRVREIDSELAFESIFVRSTAAHTSTVLVNRRRAAKLLRLTLAGAPALPAGFDYQPNDAYIGQMRIQHGQKRPERRGMYLNSTFWAYAEHADREQAKKAWDEAEWLLQSAYVVASDPDAGNDGAVFDRWFGANRVQVVATIATTLGGMQQRCTGLSYAGLRVGANPYRIVEMGFNGDGDINYAVPRAEFGSGHSRFPGYLQFETKFFNPAKTSAQRITAHTPQGLEMEVSRGGAVVHEATHLFARTEDVTVAQAVFNHLNIQAIPGQKGYGPKACEGMAQVQRDGAVRNADSYRLFCEDANLY
jgi:hypothetical protein